MIYTPYIFIRCELWLFVTVYLLHTDVYPCVLVVYWFFCNYAYRSQLDRWWCQQQCIELGQFI